MTIGPQTPGEDSRPADHVEHRLVVAESGEPVPEPAPATLARTARPVPLWRRPGPLLLAGGAVAVALALVALGYALGRSSLTEDRGSRAAESTSIGDESGPTRLEAAKERCAPRSSYVRVADEGTSLIISGAGAEEEPGATIRQAFCVLSALDVPEAVVSHIESTRALDGRQHASWDGLTASWTYHPDSGLNLILQEER